MEIRYERSARSADELASLGQAAHHHETAAQNPCGTCTGKARTRAGRDGAETVVSFPDKLWLVRSSPMGQCALITTSTLVDRPADLYMTGDDGG